MAFGPDGAIYVSNFGFAAPTGQILRIQLPTAATGPTAAAPRVHDRRCP